MSPRRDGDDGFAARWSRLKREARDPADAPAEAEAPAEDEPAGTAGAVDRAAEEKSDGELLEELGLPDPDTLSQGDDFTGFMKRAVPTRLRNRALRRLWRLDPVLANLDNLVDYGEDFTDAAYPGGKVQTAYQVGRGFLDKIAALEEQGAAVADAPEDAPGDAPEDAPDDGAGGETVAEAAGDPPETTETTPEPAPATRRKTMRFKFDDTA